MFLMAKDLKHHVVIHMHLELVYFLIKKTNNTEV